MFVKVWSALLFVVFLIHADIVYAQIIIEPKHTFIIHPELPTSHDLKSARILQHYLRLSFQSETGFDIVNEKQYTSSDSNVQIALGKTHYVKGNEIGSLKKYGYIIESFSDSLICIYGNTNLSTLLGTTCLLDSIFDIRFYLPGNDFVYYPRHEKSLSIAPISIYSEPFTDYVMATGFLTDFMNEYEIAECWGLIRKDWGSHQHTMSERFPKAQYANRYAEIYPMIDSVGHKVRYYPESNIDQHWQPDFSNPIMVEAAVKSTIEYFRKFPQRTHIAFSVQDGGIYPDSKYMSSYFEKYPSTKKGHAQAYTHAFVDFLNKTAIQLETTLPKEGISSNKTIVYIAYGQVRELPPVKLHKNILPITVYRIAESNVLHLYDSLGTKSFIFQPFQWKQKTSRIGHHDWAQGYGYLFPRIYSNLWSKYLNELKKNELSFEYAHIESYPNWGLDGPKYYILARLLWNPNVNADRILKRFCEDMFGQGAATLMFRYFKSLETLTLEMNNGNLRRKMWRIPEQLYLSEKELLLAETAMSYIKAVGELPLTVLEKKRVNLFENTYCLSYQLMKMATIKREYGVEEMNGLKELIHSVLKEQKLALYWSRNENGEEMLIKYLRSVQ